MNTSVAEIEVFSEGVRRALDVPGRGDADARLLETGWLEAVDAWGGTALHTVFIELGRACVRSGALDDILSHAMGIEPGSAVLLPPGRSTLPTPSPAGLQTWHCTSRIDSTEFVVVVCDVGASHHAFRLPKSRLTVTPMTGLDPDGRWSTVEIDQIDGAEDLGPISWPLTLAWGQLALASELVGLARAMIDLAREHALTRVQFGRPIATFQAVRHRLADAWIDVDAAHAAVRTAMEPRASEAPSTVHAAICKALAGRAARNAARHTQQVLAGIGFTAEHPFHRYLRRALLLDHCLGSASAVTTELGESALATGTLLFELPL